MLIMLMYLQSLTCYKGQNKRKILKIKKKIKEGESQLYVFIICCKVIKSLQPADVSSSHWSKTRKIIGLVGLSISERELWKTCENYDLKGHSINQISQCIPEVVKFYQNYTIGP